MHAWRLPWGGASPVACHGGWLVVVRRQMKETLESHEKELQNERVQDPCASPSEWARVRGAHSPAVLCVRATARFTTNVARAPSKILRGPTRTCVARRVAARVLLRV